MMARLAHFARGLTLAGFLVVAPVAALFGIPPRWPSELAESWDDISSRCEPSRWRAAVAQWLPAKSAGPQPGNLPSATEPWAMAGNISPSPNPAVPGTYFPPDENNASATQPAALADGRSLAAGQLTPTDSRLTDRFREIQDRLAALGATYMRLEADPIDQGRYRFYCQMALAQHYDVSPGEATHHPFEAVADDPVLAMEQVLASVETWRAARM